MAKFTSASSFEVVCCPTCNRPFPARRKSSEQRFWEKVKRAGPDDCWEWQAARNVLGYGNLQFNGRVESAHRASYLINKGNIKPGLSVCHKCDNPACVNPNHLFLGTHKINMQDAKRKGRNRTTPHPGEKHWNAKLTERQVLEIRASPITQSEAAKIYGVSRSMIGMIRNRKSWAHI